MALVHPKSCESVHTGLDLFSVPPTQTAVEEGQFVEYHPCLLCLLLLPLSLLSVEQHQST